jgi:CelD/BcsL family acetyltransferase involved in cellulose biosynthesis
LVSLIARLDELQTGTAPAEGTAIPRMEKLSLDIVGPEAAAAHIGEWRQLAANCLEPNCFLEPGFALPAANHLAKGHPPHFILVWEGPARHKLLGLCPVALPRPFVPFAQARIWTHAQAPLGTPLLDRHRAEETLAAIFAFLRQRSKSAGVMFSSLPLDGATARLVMALAAAEGRPVHQFAVHRRAILSGSVDRNYDLEGSFRSKRRKNLNGTRRRLEAEGAVSFRLSSEPEELGVEGERFLALEAKGWKGRRGTALLKSPARTSFANGVIAALAGERKCRIASLDCGGRPVAMAIVLQSGERGFFWKIAYDEAFAAFSPGVLLTLELSRALLADRGLALIDSCATADHPMIDHLWKQRMTLADVFVANGTDGKRFSTAVAFEHARHNLRGLLKRVMQRLRQLKESRSRRSASSRARSAGAR